MRFIINLLSLCLALVGVHAQNQTLVDGCPKGSYECLDVINSSQCIEQIVLEHQSNITKAAMVKCVETEGVASNLPGATKAAIPHR
ncbi:uncharacterized protein PAC_00207 [Phialocephala subalpina]|uniref:Extracellular membrane protein CFEM domain-containing protein n=1 Tax=Phialocephala subalpina TaxID=576137 RepID=A0A1L7WC18_9HELO|nr:uncharacterized protein PAC_00207 [Phialocephala subalpina]